MIKILLNIIIVLALWSCIQQPEEPINNFMIKENHGAYILCEGLYGQNNSTLSRYSFISNNIYNNIFGTTNPELRIGDTANDIIIIGDTTFIVVSTNRKIIAIETRTGKYINEIIFNTGSFPRNIIKYNDSIVFVSDLYRHSIIKINYRKMAIIHDNILSGPAPEGLAIYNEYLFVANSGYGDYLSHLENAGTISIFNLTTMQIIKRFKSLPNVIELKVSDKTGKLYARYNHLPKFKDSVGGIVEYDLQDLTEIRRWNWDSYNMELSETGDSLFILTERGLELIELDSGGNPNLVVKNSKNDEIWTSCKINYYSGEIWITNSKNFQSSGELLIYDLFNSLVLKRKLNLGLNPNTIVFF